jgi:hypothetical protein
VAEFVVVQDQHAIRLPVPQRLFALAVVAQQTGAQEAWRLR